jgi:hypothetical protein
MLLDNNVPLNMEAIKAAKATGVCAQPKSENIDPYLYKNTAYGVIKKHKKRDTKKAYKKAYKKHRQVMAYEAEQLFYKEHLINGLIIAGSCGLLTLRQGIAEFLVTTVVAGVATALCYDQFLEGELDMQKVYTCSRLISLALGLCNVAIFTLEFGVMGLLATTAVAGVIGIGYHELSNDYKLIIKDTVMNDWDMVKEKFHGIKEYAMSFVDMVQIASYKEANEHNKLL